MKLFILSLLILSFNIHADSVTPKKDWYLGLSYGFSGNDSSSYFDGSESVSNTVGNGGMRTEIELGLVRLKSDRLLYTKVYTYIWKHDQNKNNELGLGIGLQGGIFVTKNLAVTIGAKGGIGNQKTKGNSFMTKSGTSTISYITGQSLMVPMEAEYTKDTDVIEIGLLLDFDYYLTEKISLNLGFSYIMSDYGFSYELADGKFTQLNVTQDNYYSSLGLNIGF